MTSLKKVNFEPNISQEIDVLSLLSNTSNGCNAVVQGKGGWVWEPCPADEGKMEPFTDAEIAEAQSLLYKAVHDVHVPENLVEDMESWKRKMK